LVPISLVRSRKVIWLWDRHLPAGELSIVAGQEKLGKSVTLLWVTARLTRGELLGDRLGQPSAVVYISSEDHAETALKARAVVAGADPALLHVLHPSSYGFDMEKTLATKPAMVVLDPLSAFIELKGNANEHGEVVMRQALVPFINMAHHHNVAVVGIRHFRKSSTPGDNPYDVILGSKAWSAAARSLVFFVPDPRYDASERRALIYPRGNLAAPGAGSRYHLDVVTRTLDDGTQDEIPLHVPDLEPAGMTLEEALGPRQRAGDREAAKRFLSEILHDDAMDAKNVSQEATVLGISPATLRRAKTDLGIRVGRNGFGPGSVVVWRLPGSADTGQTEPF
jgi:hypothetical protein